MVAIKRKFGTPVIATADPDDLSAQETVRTAIGRDFISVVASNDQIGEYLDRLFGNGNDKQVRPTGEDVGEVYNGQEPGTEDPVPARARTRAPANGKSRRLQDQPKPKERKSKTTSTTGGVGEADPKDAADPPDAGPENGAEVALEEAKSKSVPNLGISSDPSVDELDGEKPAAEKSPPVEVGEDVGSLKPATNLLPEFGATSEPEGPVSPGGHRTAPVDELAELALSVQGEEEVPGADSTALAADLVAEAVATFQEQQGEEDRHEDAGLSASPGTSLFPPLAKSLVDGGRVSLEDMETVLEEHYRTGAEYRPHPDRTEAGNRSRPHVGNGRGDGPRLRGPRHGRG